MTETEDFDRFLSGDMPDSLIDRDSLRGGVVILPIIGIIYLYGAIYILNRRYFYPAIEHLIGLIDEKYAPPAYCLLNTAIYFFIMLYSVCLSQDNFGISTILGSDAVNLLLVMGVVQWRVKTFTEIDPWVFIKESAFYLGNILIAAAFFSFQLLKWWMALLWLLYFCIYILYFQKKNEQLRDKIALLIGLKDEDDVFNCEPNYKMIKRRNSLTEIVEKELVDFEDQEIQRKIRRNEGALKIQLKDISKFRDYSNFQRLVYKVIYALQKKNEFEKEERSRLYREKVQKLNEKAPSKKVTRNLENEVNVDGLPINEKGEGEEETLIEKDKINQPFHPNNDDISPGPLTPAEKNIDVLNRINVDDENANPDENRKDEMIIPSHSNLDNLGENNINDLDFPETAPRRAIFILFYPVRVVFHLMLFTLKKQITLKSVGYSIAIVLFLQASMTFLMVWWTNVITDALDIQPEVAGLSFTSVGVSISFIIYNLKLQTNQHNANFLTTFELMGIYKFGFAATLGWLAYFVFSGNGSTDVITQGFQYSTFVYAGFFAASIGAIAAFKIRIHRKLMLPYGVGYVAFLIVVIVLCSSLTDPS